MNVKISSLQLEAFHEVARELNFTKASRNLNITQSALSQRILNLEDQLGLTLLIREAGRVRLTAHGEKVLRYCQSQSGFEGELLRDLKGTGKGIGGALRIAGFSSVMWSVIVPALGELVKDNPDLQADLKVAEYRDLPGLLRGGSADYLVCGEDPDLPGVETERLGFEENVLVEPRQSTGRRDSYLDHDPDDKTTIQFLKRGTRKQPDLKRSYMDDIHGIIAGVAHGWGAAVVPRHLIAGRRDLKVREDHPAQKSPVFLCYYRQPYYTRLHGLVVETLKRRCPEFLSS